MHEYKAKPQFLHLDSIFAQYLTDFADPSGVPNAYNAQYKFHSCFKNVERIYLTSLEMPVGFSNVRKGSTDKLSFLVNGNIINVILKEKNYTTMTSLVADLNLACLGVVPNVVFTFSISPSEPRLLITIIGQINFFSIIDTNLSKYILGFREKYDVLVSNVYIASYSTYNLNSDSYIHIHLSYVPGVNASMLGGAKSSFKLPFNTVANNVYYFFESSSFTQFIDCRNSNFNLSSMTIVLYDRYGNPISSKGQDYSVTFKIEYID
jgi:hypothetical protein